LVLISHGVFKGHFPMFDDNLLAPAPAIRSLSDTRTMTALIKPAAAPSVRRRLPPASAEMPERDSFPATGLADMLDRSLHANIGRFTAGLSPAALIMAYFDWAAHIAAAPGKRIGLADKAMRKSMRLFDYVCRCGLEGGSAARCIEPLPQDRRFACEPWQHWPFNAIY
jgi:polyhydroxyalkanoate synthase